MVLIVLHEVGHFAAAKAVGMRVERFSLFFPPLLLRKKVGETEYALGAIPLGGYVKISGMNPSRTCRTRSRPGLPRAAGLEADRGDRGGPAREPRDRVRAPLRVPGAHRAATREASGRSRSRRASRPRPRSSRATAWWPSTASADFPTSSPRRSPSTSAPGAARRGCRAPTRRWSRSSATASG